MRWKLQVRWLMLSVEGQERRTPIGKQGGVKQRTKNMEVEVTW